ncbi:MAG: MFS transporter [Candidatus Rokubacteria bacterium]|nr:MFS transporter [Candidatus Rokubacteria bacterium]
MTASPPAALRWVMWSIPTALFLIAFFHRVAPGVIAKELMQAFGATGAIVGLLSATYFYAYAGLMIPAGLLIDRFGVRAVVASGGAVMGLGTVAMGVASEQSALFAGRFLVGAGASVTFVGALKIAANWFPPSQFGTISAITATMGVLGSLVATAPLAWLVALSGWRGALLVVGLVTLAASVACGLAVRDFPGGVGEVPPRPADWRAVMGGMFRVLGNPHTWPPFLAFFCLYAAAGNLMLWVVPYLRDVYALATTDAALFATATSLALLFAAPLTGVLSDRIVHRRKLPYTVLTGCQFVLWVVLVATLGALPLAGVYALFFAMGVVGGAFVLTWPIGREVNPPHLAGIAVAVVNLGGFLGAALTQGPVGALLDARWAGATAGGARVYPVDAYGAAFAVCALFVLASALMTLLMRETRGRNIYQEP